MLSIKSENIDQLLFFRVCEPRNCFSTNSGAEKMSTKYLPRANSTKLSMLFNLNAI